MRRVYGSASSNYIHCLGQLVWPRAELPNGWIRPSRLVPLSPPATSVVVACRASPFSAPRAYPTTTTHHHHLLSPQRVAPCTPHRPSFRFVVTSLPALPRPSSATLAAPTPVAPFPYPPRHLARCLPYVHSYSTLRPFHTPRIPGVGVSSTHHHSTSSSAASLPPTTPCSTPRLTSHRTRTLDTLLNPTSPPSGNLPITYSASKVRRVSTRPTRHDCVGRIHRLSVCLVCACVGARVNWARWRVRVERYYVFRLSSCVV